MTREIIFRAWDIKHKCWIEKDKQGWDFLISSEGIISRYKPFENTMKLLENIVIQQFIELKDKNGKEIYEGDKIKGEYVRGTDEILKINGIIEYQNTQSCYVVNDGKVMMPLMYFIDGLEIIGNIFEEGEKDDL